MTTSDKGAVSEGATRLLETVSGVEQTALDAVRKFIETVDGVFPDISQDAPRRKIIDSAFKMTEQLMGASNKFAEKLVSATESTLTSTKHEAKSA